MPSQIFFLINVLARGGEKYPAKRESTVFDERWAGTDVAGILVRISWPLLHLLEPPTPVFRRSVSFTQLHLFTSFFSTRGPRKSGRKRRACAATPLLGLPIGTGDFAVPRSSCDHSTRKARVRTAGQFGDRTRAVPSIQLGAFNHDSASFS